MFLGLYMPMRFRKESLSMNNESVVHEWLRRAKSNLARAKAGKINADVILEDLCFDAQQAAEKALKALCLFHGIAFSHTHNIGELLTLLNANDCIVPTELDGVDALTEYAVTTRYPGDWDPVDKEEYQEALALAEKVFAWVSENLTPKE